MSAKKPAPAPAKPAAAPAKPGVAPAKPGVAPAKPAAAAANDVHAAPAKKRRALPVLALLFSLCVAGAGGWHYLRYLDAQAAPGAREAAGKKTSGGKPAEPVFLALEPFTVNLTTVNIDRFLQVGVTMELDSAEASERVKRYMPVVRSRMLLLLASKTADELATPAGKQRLVDDLLREARVPLPEAGSPRKGIENVHFSTFVVQ